MIIQAPPELSDGPVGSSMFRDRSDGVRSGISSRIETSGNGGNGSSKVTNSRSHLKLACPEMIKCCRDEGHKKPASAHACGFAR